MDSFEELLGRKLDQLCKDAEHDAIVIAILLSLEPFNYTTPKYKSFLNHNGFYPHFYVYM